MHPSYLKNTHKRRINTSLHHTPDTTAIIPSTPSEPNPSMYISDTHKSRPPPPPPPAINFYKDPHHHLHHPVHADDDADRDMIIEVVAPATEPLPAHHPQMVIAAGAGDSGSGGEDPDGHTTAGGGRSSSAVAPKKRAETWVQDETRSLISLRREMDSMFNTSKSNKHLWEQISAKMREKGFDRSPTMCTDKWRNLLKEFKKVKQQNSSGNNGAGGGGAAKMSYYKEIDEILRERGRNAATYKSPNSTVVTSAATAVASASSVKVDSFMQFSDKGIEDTSIPYGPIEANDRQTLNLERTLDHDGHPLAITAADPVGTSGVPPSFWRETPGNGDETHSYVGRVISVKWGEYTRRIGIDGTAEAISLAIKSAFGIRSKRAFWLEDEDQVVRSLDRDMPLGNYTLHLDEGVSIKVCHYDESDHIPVHTEEKTFYSEEDLREFLNRRGWSAFRELHGYRSFDNLDDLRSDVLYRGVT